MKVVLIGAALAVAAYGTVPLGDASRGEALFRSQNCVTCHSVNGEGGRAAPDLGRGQSREYTPALMAALMWNHAPQMWSAMEKAGITKPQLNSQQSADLFAYFYAARFFEHKGDAARGRKAFVEKSCSECHSLSPTAKGTGPEVLKWNQVTDAIELARQMWNHGAPMQAAMKAKGVKKPAMTAMEMNDITVYLQNLPQAKGLKPEFAPASAETGETLFKAKGCAGCHTGARSLAKPGVLRSTADLAAAMWNHPVLAEQKSPLRPEEMKRLVGYVWTLQFSDEGGAWARGSKVFESKGCMGCHTNGPGPRLQLGEKANSFEMVAALWSHGPTMQTAMRSKGVAWPRFVNTDMADVIAYLKRGQ